jgi:BirA family biotin operon repressor/biotin-[acetyl-CoA-carboxylase] ligase
MEEMREIPLDNPFGAPVFFLETTSSLMSDIRTLAARGAPHGTMVLTDLQKAGRGRVKGRPWKSEKGKNLLLALLLRYPAASMPAALTLRVALGLLRAIEDLVPALRGKVRVKWPNDVMLPLGGAYRKAAGILAEGDGACVYVGAGVNVEQTLFPEDIRDRAGSIALALGDAELPEGLRLSLASAFLGRLRGDLEGGSAPSWRDQLEERLYLRGSRALFLAGAADSPRRVEGLLHGLGMEGELLIQTAEGLEAFVSGELDAYQGAGLGRA